jgi:hypothetical protein
MEFELVILAQFIAFLVVSMGTIFAVSAPRTGELIRERQHPRSRQILSRPCAETEGL